MKFYQVVIGHQEWDPFEGEASIYVHKTIKGAWMEIESRLNEVYSDDSIFIDSVDINIKNKYVEVSYKRIGFSIQPMGVHFRIQTVSVVL